MKATFFKDVGATVAYEKDYPTWEDFTSVLETVHADSKHQLPLVKLGTFGDTPTDKGCLRNDGNMGLTYGVECDYDAGRVSLLEAATTLRAYGVKAYVHETPSSTPEAPRWRILAPLSIPHPPALHSVMVGRMNTILNGALAKESFTPSQSFYVGHVNGHQVKSMHTEGACIDTLNHIAPTYPRAETDRPADVDSVSDEINAQQYEDLRSALKHLSPEEYADWITIGNNLKHLGLKGKLLWLEWSLRSDKFDERQAEKKWEQLDSSRSDYRGVFSKATDAGWENVRQVDVSQTPWDKTGAVTAPARKSLVSHKMGDFLNLESVFRTPLLGEQFVKSSINMLYSERGLGKSFACIGMAYAMATGTGFWNMEGSGRESKVLYVDGEMSQALTQGRFMGQGDVTDNLEIVSLDTNEGTLPDLATLEGQVIFDELFDRVKPEVVFLDNLSSLVRGGKENDAESWGLVKEWLFKKRSDGMCIIVVHHSGKSGDQRGTSAREDAMDVVIQLKKPLDYHEQDGAKFDVFYTKGRHLKPAEKRTIRVALKEINGRYLWDKEDTEKSMHATLQQAKANGMSLREMSTEFKLTSMNVSRILNGEIRAPDDDDAEEEFEPQAPPQIQMPFSRVDQSILIRIEEELDAGNNDIDGIVSAVSTLIFEKKNIVKLINQYTGQAWSISPDGHKLIKI